MQRYDKEDAAAILGPCNRRMADIRDDGVWPSAAFVEGNAHDQLRWNYASELNWPGSPNPLSAPSLPIPFSANELAAFMLDGIGATIPATYLHWNQGLDEDMLERMGINAMRPREALWAAYSLLRDAEVVVGEQPKDLERSHTEATYKYPIKFAKWRKAMVRHLIRPPMTLQEGEQSSPAIVLPPGTKTVDVIDIPNLISETLYCRLLAEGRLPEGATELPDDENERLRSVQLYKLTLTHSNGMRNAIKTGMLVPISRVSRMPCGIDDIADAYVSVDAFKAYVGNAYDDIEVRVAGAQLQEETNRSADGGNGFEEASPSQSLTWSLKNRPAKFTGYSEALYSFLESAQSKERFEKLGFGWELQP